MRTYVVVAFSCLLLGAGFASSNAADTPYAVAVKTLQPTYYYQLNEPDATGGVIDAMGHASPGSYNGDYVNGLPQAGCPGPIYINEGQDGQGQFEYYETAVPGVGGAANLAHCSNNEGHILLGPSGNFGSADITVSLFFRADSQQGGDRLFTNNLLDPETSFQVNVAGEGLVVAVNPNETGLFAERTLQTDAGAYDTALVNNEYGWFHVVASTQGEPDDRADNIQVWVNGVNRTENLVVTNWGWGVDTDFAKIGGRRADPKDSTTHSGAQDEVAIWLGRVLTDADVQSLWKAATEGVPAFPGDHNANGTLDAGDLDLQAVAMVGGLNPAAYDLNNDTLVNYSDRLVWLHDLKKTWVGDSDLNGLFESADFVLAFQAGKYEVAGATATWQQGDWDGNQLFTSADFVAAFADGGYEAGPRAAVSAVPEPGSIVLAIIGLLGLTGLARRR